ncbi:MAG: DUF4358 domain-containing protein [Lachnospiraceae bacterium]
MKKKNLIGSIILISCCCMMFSGCGKEQKKKTEGPKIPATEVMEVMLKAAEDTEISTTVSFGEEKYGDNFEFLYNFSMDEIGDGSISYAQKGKSADEISLLYVKDHKNMAKVMTALKARITRRIQDFTGYAPEELSKIEGAKVIEKGNYAVLIITDNTDEVSKAFEKALKK